MMRHGRCCKEFTRYGVCSVQPSSHRA
jgi:hypothetical protein